MIKKNSMIRAIALFLGIFLCNNLAADNVRQPIRLSPDEAVERALRNNLGLQASRNNVETRRRASDLSWNQFIPSLTAGGSLIMNYPRPTISGLAPVEPLPLNPILGLPPDTPNIYGVTPFTADLPRWNVAGSIQASLNISLAMFENMNRLRLDYEGGLLSYERARAQLERDIRRAYHNMLLLYENIALLRGSFENAERQVQMAHDNFYAGLVPELTLLQAQVARENLRPVIDQAEHGLRLAMAQFAFFLDMPYDTPFELIPVEELSVFVPLDVTYMISRAAASRPDIQELRHSILLLESARTMQERTLFPTLSLGWNHNSVFMQDPWRNNWFSRDDWRNSGSLTLSLGLRLHSLFPFSQDTQAIRNIEDQIRAANIGLAQMIRGTEIEVFNIILSLERIRVSAEVQQQTVELAERAFQLTEQAYQAGLQDLFQVQNAEQALRQAHVQMLEQQFSYLNGLIDLEYHIGVPFGTLSSTRSN